jgi:hypothetical protein
MRRTTESFPVQRFDGRNLSLHPTPTDAFVRMKWPRENWNMWDVAVPTITFVPCRVLNHASRRQLIDPILPLRGCIAIGQYTVGLFRSHPSLHPNVVPSDPTL